MLVDGWNETGLPGFKRLSANTAGEISWIQLGNVWKVFILAFKTFYFQQSVKSNEFKDGIFQEFKEELAMLCSVLF